MYCGQRWEKWILISTTEWVPEQSGSFTHVRVLYSDTRESCTLWRKFSGCALTSALCTAFGNGNVHATLGPVVPR